MALGSKRDLSQEIESGKFTDGGACGSVVVKVLRIDSRWRHWGFFPWFLPTKPCALRSIQPLKMSTRDFSWGKGGRCVRLTTLVMPNVEMIRGLNLPGTPRTTSACRGTPVNLLMMVLRIRIQIWCVIYWSAERLLAYQEELFSIELDREIRAAEHLTFT